MPLGIGIGIGSPPHRPPRFAIVGATNASPIVITTAIAHGWSSGAVIAITGVTGNTAANGTWTITVPSSTQFSIPVAGNGAYAGGGYATRVG